MAEPIRDRPSVPDTYRMPGANGEMVEWVSVLRRLEAARNSWVLTATEAGNPHATPLWGVWVDDRFYLEGGPRTVWARNIRRNPHANIHLDDSDNVASVYGTFTDIPDVGPEIHGRILAAYDAKYDGYRPPDPHDRGYYVLVPTRAFAWTEFPRTATDSGGPTAMTLPNRRGTLPGTEKGQVRALALFACTCDGSWSYPTASCIGFSR